MKDYNPIIVSHQFVLEEVRNFPDILFKLLLRQLVLRFTDPKDASNLSLDQAITILESEADYLHAQISKATQEGIGKKQ